MPPARAIRDDRRAALRVLIVDRHEPTRLGLSLIVRAAAEVERTLPADEPATAVELARRHGADIALLDTSDGGLVAIPLARALLRVAPDVRVVLTGRRRNPSRALLRTTRAVAVVPLDATAAETRSIVVEAGNGGERRATVPQGPLSPREAQVLSLLVTGATNREIARELQVGPDSIKKHASAVYRKLGVRNRTEAAQVFRDERANA